jgi:hypothetical protein
MIKKENPSEKCNACEPDFRLISPGCSRRGTSPPLYKEQQGGASPWMETQNVQPDFNGHYTVLLFPAWAERLR